MAQQANVFWSRWRVTALLFIAALLSVIASKSYLQRHIFPETASSAWILEQAPLTSGSLLTGINMGLISRRCTLASKRTSRVRKESAPGCHPDCIKRGNCNLAEGRCECPFGLQGEACEQLAFPACRLVNMTLDQADAANISLLITCAENMRLNCECHRCAFSLSDGLPKAPMGKQVDKPHVQILCRQCYEHYCPDGGDKAACRTKRDAMQKCFIYKDLPHSQQVTNKRYNV